MINVTNKKYKDKVHVYLWDVFQWEVNRNFEKIFWRMKAFCNSCHGSKFETTTNTSEHWFNSLKNTSQTKMDFFFSFIKWK